MKKPLSWVTTFSIVIAVFLINDRNQQSIALAASLSRTIQQEAPLKLASLEELIKSKKLDIIIANDIKNNGLAFQLTENQFVRLKQLGAGPETIRALRALIKPPVKPAVPTPSKVEPASNKVIILVASFDGPDSQQYRVTEHIIGQLKAATKKYSDIEIQPLAQSITELQGGSEVARDIGMKRKASIVLWGWYAANVEASSIHTYFEVLRAPKYLSLSQNIEKQTATISELRGFKIQIKLSGEMAYLTLLTVGLARYESGDYDGAIDRFTTAIAQSDVPNQMVSPADIYFYRGNAHYYKAGVNGIDNAIADYDNAIKFKPDYAVAYNNRGNAYDDKNEHDRAIADYDKAIKLKPDLADTYNNRGIAYTSKGDYDRAIADFNEATKLKPDYADVYYNRGVTYGKKGDHDRAIADYNYAIKLKPDDAVAYNNRGVAYTSKGNYDRAIADFNEATKLKPDYAIAYYNRGVAYSKKGEPDRAIADFNEATKLKPDDAVAYYNRGIAYNKKGEYDRAIADFNQAIKYKPDYADAYNNRGVAYGSKGDYARALADFNQAIKLIPDNANAYFGRGFVYKLKGERERAIADLNHFLQITKDLKLRQLAQEILQKLGVK